MRKLLNSSGSILVVVILICLAVAALLSLKSNSSSSNPSSFPIADVANVTEASLPAQETIEETPSPSSYPPPVEVTPWVPSPSPSPTLVVLPPLTHYPTPGPFKGMKVLYTKLDPPGYYIGDVNSGEEKSFNQWWKKDKQSVLGQLSYKVSPDGSKVLYGVWSNYSISEPNANAIWVSDPEGNDPQQLVAGNKEWIPEEPIWSPDGQQIAFRKVYFKESGKWDVDHNRFEIWVIDAKGDNSSKIYESQTMPFHTGFGKLDLFKWYDNGYLYFSPGILPNPVFALDPISGKSYLIVDRSDPLDWQLRLAQDGEHMLASSDTPVTLIQSAGLLGIDLKAGAVSGKFGGHGSKILFIVESSEGSKIDVKDLATGNEIEITTLKTIPISIEFSPDGNYIIYKDENEAIFAYSLLTGKSTQVIQSKKLDRESNINFIDWIPVK